MIRHTSHTFYITETQKKETPHACWMYKMQRHVIQGIIYISTYLITLYFMLIRSNLFCHLVNFVNDVMDLNAFLI